MLSHNIFTKAMSTKGPFLGVFEKIPATFNAEASGYSCLVTLGLGLRAVGSPRISDPTPPPQNELPIMDHVPHNPPPPPQLPSKMIHDLPDHPCRHVMIQGVVTVTHSASTKHHIDPLICVKKRSKNVSCKKEMTRTGGPVGGSFLFWNLHFWIIFFPHKLVDHFFFGTYIFGSFLFR